MNQRSLPRVLVTGAAGFVGGHLVQLLARQGFDAVGAVRKPAQIPTNEMEYFAAELSSPEAVSKLIQDSRPQAIIHCAAAANAAACEADPEMAERENVTAVSNLVQAAVTIPFIHISTDLVFDDYDEAPAGGFRESDQVRARTAYGRSKARAENLVLSYPEGTVLRVALVYGPPLAVIPTKAAENRASGMMGWLIGGLKRRDRIELFTDEWRTPVYIGDIADAAAAVVRSSQMKSGAGVSQAADFQHRIFHLGGAERVSRYYFGLAAAEAYRLSTDSIVPASRVEFIKNNRGLPHRPADVSLCISLIESAFNLRPLDVREGLRRCAAAAE